MSVFIPKLLLFILRAITCIDFYYWYLCIMAHPLIDFHVYLFYFLKVKDAVRDYLPPDEPATRKNPLYRNLFDGFDRIDGKPTEAERKVWIFVEEL